MQFLALFSSWISIAIIYAPIALSSSFFLERDLPDVAPDPSPFNDEPSLEDINPWDQDIGLDSNGLLAGNALTPITESDSNWSLDENGYLDESGSNFLPADNDIACGVDDVGNTQLFGKVRRENLCRDPPVGQAGKPDGSGQDPFAELNKFITDTVALASFPEDLQVCPVKNFETSNIPVCKEDNPDDVVTIPEFHGFYLFNIDPMVFLSCPAGVTLWCCRNVVYVTKHPSPPPLEADELDRLSQEPAEAFIRQLAVARYNYIGVVCYQQASPPL